MRRSVLLMGPPGYDKFIRARQMYNELPTLSQEVAVETTWIHLGARLTTDTPVTSPPFRAPHHTVSNAGLTGSANERVRPGEVSLAHGGCLVLDQLPEFQRVSIESLALVLRDGVSVFSFQGMEVRLPANPALLCATADPCPCGDFGSSSHCRCDGKSRMIWLYRLAKYCDMLGISEMI